MTGLSEQEREALSTARSRIEHDEDGPYTVVGSMETLVPAVEAIVAQRVDAALEAAAVRVEAECEDGFPITSAAMEEAAALVREGKADR